GPSVDDIIAEARRANVTVYFVALKGAGYSDTSAIERIAAETGGSTLLVGQAEQLTQSFRALSDSLFVSGYRVAVIDADHGAPCKLTIGGQGAVTLTISSDAAESPLAQALVP